MILSTEPNGLLFTRLPNNPYTPGEVCIGAHTRLISGSINDLG